MSDIKIMWEVSSYGDNPFKLEIVSETEKTFTIKTTGWNNKEQARRIMKSGRNIFDTWDDAKNFMVARAEKYIETLNRRLDQARNELEKVKALR